MEYIIKFNNGMVLDTYKVNRNYMRLEEYTLRLHEPIEELIFTEIMLNNNIETYINLGVHIGYYTILGKLLSPTTRVIGFEGLPEFEKYIHNNLKLNNLSIDDIELNFSFIGSKESHYDKETSNDKVTVLSEFIKDFKKIDLISTDIQGSEIVVLKDLDKSGEIKRVKNIILGTHTNLPMYMTVNIHQKCIDILKKNNFEIKYEAAPGKVWLQSDGIVWAKNRII